MKKTTLKRKTRLHRKHVFGRGIPKPRSINEELDALVRQIVLIRDDVRCQRCGINARPGRGGGLEVAHIYPKGAYPAIRHELMNVVLLCYRCHHVFWHRNPIQAVEWLGEKRGGAFMAELRLMARTRTKVDREAVRIYLTAELEKLKSGKIPGAA